MASRASRRLARLISTPFAPSCRSPIAAARDELGSGSVCGGAVSIANLPVTAAAAAGAAAPSLLRRSQLPILAAGAGMRSSNSTSFHQSQAAATAAAAAAAAAQASTVARARKVLPAAAAVATGSSVAASSQVNVGAAARCTVVRSFSAAAGAAPAAAAAATSGAQKSRFPRKRLLGAAALAGLLGGGVVVSTQDPGTISEWWFRAMDFCTPAFHLFDPETAHDLAIFAASLRLLPHEHRPDPPILATSVWGRAFPNPIGLAAGWDKDAKAVDGVLDLGFGFTEVGSVTPIPQAGNPKPRIFRLPEEQAVINRYGFNSEGIAAVAERLGKHFGHRRTAERPEAHTSRNSSGSGESSSVATERMRGLVAVNLGKNRTTADAASDYVQGVYTLAQYADILVVNVSSPNTPGLRKLQGRKQLQDLVKKVLAARDEMQWGEEGPPPLLVKVAPDLSREDMADIAAVALSTKVDGLVVGNTTVSRPDCVLGLLNVEQEGGLSGRPLMDLSTHVLREMYRLTQGRIPLIGCGGVSSGQDAYEKIRAGASLVQIYTALIYQGPGVVPRIKRELAELLQRDGFNSVEEAVGADHR